MKKAIDKKEQTGGMFPVIDKKAALIFVAGVVLGALVIWVL